MAELILRHPILSYKPPSPVIVPDHPDVCCDLGLVACPCHSRRRLPKFAPSLIVPTPAPRIGASTAAAQYVAAKYVADPAAAAAAAAIEAPTTLTLPPILLRPKASMASSRKKTVYFYRHTTQVSVCALCS